PDLSATARIITARRHGVLSVPIISLTVREPSDTLPPAPGGAHRGGAAADTAKGHRPAAESTQAPGREIEGRFIVDTTSMQARFHPVHVGIAGDEYFEVLGGVQEGQTIVAGPYQAIRDLHNDARVKQARGGRGGAGDQAKRQ